jgi:hypothetical protein
MNKAWPLEEHRCDLVVDKTGKCIQNDMARVYQRRGWNRIAPLHGCDTQGRVVRAALPRVYATIKSKCIPESGIITELKARPITPHTKVVLKRVYNKVATAFLFVLRNITKQRTMRLWDTHEYVPRAVNEMRELMKQRGGPLKQLHVL